MIVNLTSAFIGLYFRSATEIQMCLCHELYALYFKLFVFKNRIKYVLVLAAVS